MLVDPWGQVVACASDGPGLALGFIERERIERIQRAMPVAQHRRLT
jgi:nitrilase